MDKKQGMYYIVSLDDSFIGVNKKIETQKTIFEKEGINCRVVNVYQSKKFLYQKILSRCTFSNYNSNWNIVNKLNSQEIYYFRYTPLDKGFYETIKRLKRENSNTRILLEIPTYPYDAEHQKDNFINYFIGFKDKFYRKKIYKYVDKIVTFSNDNSIFGIETIKISNGFNKDLIKPKNVYSSESTNLIAVATFAKWHGYDRLIEGLNLYYKNGGKENINIFFVGDGPELYKYKKLVQQYNLNKNIYFCGRLIGKELDNIYDKSHLAIDSLGRHRGGIKYNSTLKGKEYLGKGLPIVSGVETELDYDYDFKYYLRVPADDSPIDINSLLDYYKNIYNNNNNYEIIKEIRKYAEEKFAWESSLNPLIKYLKNI